MALYATTKRYDLLVKDGYLMAQMI